MKDNIEMKLLEFKQYFLKGLIYLLKEEGNDLTLGDKIIIRNEVNKYVDNYFESTKEIPKGVLGNFYYIIYKNLQLFGFKIEYLDKWGEDRVKECTRYANEVKLLKKIYGEDVIYY